MRLIVWVEAGDLGGPLVPGMYASGSFVCTKISVFLLIIVR